MIGATSQRFFSPKQHRIIPPGEYFVCNNALHH
jgi:hypothetical protein